MKKIAFIILAMLLPILPIMADELTFTVDGLNYQHLGGLNQAVRLLGYKGDKCPQKVIIPATVSNAGKTYSVDVISSGAFLGCVDLISVEMKSSGDNGVKYIDPNSFAGCTNLSKVGFSGVLKAIYAPGFSGQRGAFEGCTSLKTIVLPASMDYMGEVDATAPHNICKWAFKNCTGLKTVIINASRPYIEDEAFINCSSLQYFVSYNMHPWSLEWNTFQGIPSTANLIVPDGTKSTYQALLGWNTFNNIDEHSNVDLKAILGEEDQPQGGGTAKLSIQDFTIKAGETKTMLIDMQNPDDQVTLVQFDLRLPDGLSIATGNDATDIAGRTTWRKHTLTSNATNGITRFLLYSATNEVIEGTSGAIISIKLTASSSFNGGDIKLENQLMTTPSLVESKPATYSYNIKGGGVTPPAGDAEAYVVYNNGTLTFYCDNQRSSRQGTVYDLNKLNNSPGWLEQKETITKAIFDASFANARPTTTSQWFYECDAMTEIEGIAYLNTSSVTSMFRMFANCSGLTSLDVSKFNTGNVTNMQYMFWNCSGLMSLDVSNFNTSNATSINHMFGGCSGLMSLNVRHFNTSKVTNMTSLFSRCSGLTSLDVSNFNTGNVIYMNAMFSSCSGLTSLDVSNFDTENVTSMSSLFDGCSSLTKLNMSKFNTKNVTDMWAMFRACIKLSKLTLGNSFATTDEASCDDMFLNCISLKTIAYTGDIPYSINRKFFEGVGTANAPVTLEVPDQYRDHYAAKFDGNMFFGGYFKLSGDNPSVSEEPYVVYNDFTLTFYCDDQRSKRSGTIYSLNEGEAEPEWVLDDNNRNVEKVVFDASFAKARPTSTFQWFFYCDYLTEIKGMENLNTSEVKTMRAMFAFCKHLKSVDVSHFDTKAVLDMGAMFSSCTSLESIDVGHFDSNNVWSMISMFNNCQSLTEINLSSFNTSNVEYLSYLFNGCNNLKTVYLGSGFVSDNGVECEEAFAGCQNLSKVVFTGDVPTDINNSFFVGVGTASKPAKLDVPEQYVANYEAKFVGNMFFGGYFTLREAIVPDEKGGKDYGSGNSEIDEKTNLDGSVIGNVYYSIAPENGGYNSAEGCLVVTKPSSDNAFEIDDPFGNDFKGMFTGIVIMVQQGSGIVKVEAESSGGMTLMVKVGNGLPIQMTMLSKSTLAIPYSVDRPTYIYIYAGGSNGNARTRASSDGKLKIYSISWESSASGINSLVGEEQLYDVYSLSGTLIKRRVTSLDALPKGVYIVNGRKVAVK